MKAVLFMISAAFFCACISKREVQVEMVSAKLIKIDTVFRYPNLHEQVLTWKIDDNNLQYVSYASMNTGYRVGSRLLLLVRR